MAEGKLIIEVYEYAENAPVPTFEYIPCDLNECLRHNNQAPLKEIIQRAFGSLSRRDNDSAKCREVLQKLGEASISRINVLYHKPTASSEPCVELTNVVQVTMFDADARRAKNKKKNQNDIILYGKYRLSDGTEATKIKDGQRLSLIYSTGGNSGEYAGDYAGEAGFDQDGEAQKEICLNITYLQE